MNVPLNFLFVLINCKVRILCASVRRGQSAAIIRFLTVCSLCLLCSRSVVSRPGLHRGLSPLPQNGLHQPRHACAAALYCRSSSFRDRSVMSDAGDHLLLMRCCLFLTPSGPHCDPPSDVSTEPLPKNTGVHHTDLLPLL